MASTSEVGHVKNVANFERLITTVTALGSSYNPAKTQIKLTELNNLLADAQASLAKVIQLNVTYNNAVNARIQLFTPIKKFSTRLIGALSATDATPETLADAKAIQRKIQGQRPSAHRIINPNPDPNVPTPDPISTSQQSFDQLTEHFNKLIEVLTAEPTYAPNETALQITSLNALLADMHHAITEVNTTHVALTNQRISRNKLFYTDPHNLCEIANEVKSYVKSVFGSTSPEYKQVSKILIRKV